MVLFKPAGKLSTGISYRCGLLSGFYLGGICRSPRRPVDDDDDNGRYMRQANGRTLSNNCGNEADSERIHQNMCQGRVVTHRNTRAANRVTCSFVGVSILCTVIRGPLFEVQMYVVHTFGS